MSSSTYSMTSVDGCCDNNTKTNISANIAISGAAAAADEAATDNYIETPWKIINSYFEGRNLERLVRHQIESYNHFVNYQIMRTIDMFNQIRVVSPDDYDTISEKYALEVFITFDNFNIQRPQIHENNGAVKLMFPKEARLRNFTYAAVTTVDINVKYVVRSGENLEHSHIIHRKLPDIHIGKIPVMLKSSICVLNLYKHFTPEQTGECRKDAGGYFIIKGSEKTVIAQERAAENNVYCFLESDPKYLWKAEVKSVPDFKCISPKQLAMYILSKPNEFGHPLQISIPRIRNPIPIFIVFRALGVISDKDICNKIVLDVDAEHPDFTDFLKASIVDASKYPTQEDCLKYITNIVMYTPQTMDATLGERQKRNFAMDVLGGDLFPHCKTPTQKIYFLGYMTYRLMLAYFEILPQDDRDSYANKRVDLTGTLLNNLYRNYFNKLVKDMEKQILKEITTGSWRSTNDYENIINMTNIYKIVKSATIESGIYRALSSGDFGIKHNSNSSKVGVAQVLSRLNNPSTISHIRRISAPTEKSGKLIAPRKLHSTSWGFICPAETPEGHSVGVVKNLSVMANITIQSNSNSLHEYVAPYTQTLDDMFASAVGVPALNLHKLTKVFINGAWIGVTKTPLELYSSMKDKKYKGIINVYTSVVFNYKMNEIRICTDGGRFTRPLLRVCPNGQRPMFTADIIRRLSAGTVAWDDMLLANEDENRSSIIEYVDAEEHAYSYIANSPLELIPKKTRYTHSEIHPSTIFGVLASCIPFPEHNQSPRNTYQCAQGKQAMGVYVTNPESRMDKTAYMLNYPMRPLIDTRITDVAQMNDVPTGTQAIVAIMTHTGYNQEDSLLISKGAVDRGFAEVTVYHTEKDEDRQRINGDEEIRCRPNPETTKELKMGNYSKVNSKGVIPENTLIENRDIIIAKVAPIKEHRNDPSKKIKNTDLSKVYTSVGGEHYVDKNYIDRNGDGYLFAKVKTREIRKPIIGDKFSSRSGQKGTVGNVVPEADMPYTSSGQRPDLIINPHAIPSRMTIGHTKESLMGNLLLQLGLFGDGTSFSSLSIPEICELLLKNGFEAHGNELMYSGTTGEQIDCVIFVGYVYYQRLKHMVSDKTHSRSFGPMVKLTRQPAEGRSRNGGHRFGEMERDCMISHGTARFTRSRLYDVSDKYSVHVCKRCGLIAAYNAAKHIYLCKTCDNRADFSYVEIPYACKLLFQELNAMNIAPRIMT